MLKPDPDRVSEHERLIDSAAAAIEKPARELAAARVDLARDANEAAGRRLEDAAMAVEAALDASIPQALLTRFDALEPCGVPRLDRAVEVLVADGDVRRVDPELRREAVRRDVALQMSAGRVEHAHADPAKKDDLASRRTAWDQTMAGAGETRAALIAAVEARNRLARAAGHRDAVAWELERFGVADEWLSNLIAQLEKATRAPYRSRKAVRDASLAARFGVDVESLRPWHFEENGLRAVALPASLPLDQHFEGDERVTIASRFFDGLGFDLRATIARADLTERSLAPPSPLCVRVGDDDDVHIVAQIEPGERGLATLLGVFGQAAYLRAIRQRWPLARPAHPVLFEAVAALMRRQTTDLEFLLEYVDVPAFELTPLSGELRRVFAFRTQTTVRWALTVIAFERALYADPTRVDLDALWWELVKKYLLVDLGDDTPPPPGWAAEPALIHPLHGLTALLAEVAAAQMRASLLRRSRATTLVDNLFAGELLTQELFRHGALEPMETLLVRMTGAKLDPKHLLHEIVGP